MPQSASTGHAKGAVPVTDLFDINRTPPFRAMTSLDVLMVLVRSDRHRSAPRNAIQLGSFAFAARQEPDGRSAEQVLPMSDRSAAGRKTAIQADKVSWRGELRRRLSGCQAADTAISPGKLSVNIASNMWCIQSREKGLLLAHRSSAGALRSSSINIAELIWEGEWESVR